MDVPPRGASLVVGSGEERLLYSCNYYRFYLYMFVSERVFLAPQHNVLKLMVD